jgi:hypothetical protein
MMSIRLHISQFLSYYINNEKYVDVKGNTISDCLDFLVKEFPALLNIVQSSDGSVASYIAVFKDKDSDIPEKLNKPVSDGDEYFVEYQPG